MIRRVAAAALVVACVAGCRSEPVRVASYEWVDPAVEKDPFPFFPGATRLPLQTDLVRSARVMLQPEGTPAPRLLLSDTDAPLDAVAAHFASLYPSAQGEPAPIKKGSGDLAADEVALAPILAKLGRRFTPGIGSGAYRSAQIAGRAGTPVISLQRPYRDFIGDRVVDRTLIMITE